jgi:hypothetical protein
MTPNLQFVDKGKVIAEFTGVAFQGGTIWVDRENKIDFYKTNSGDIFWDDVEGVTSDRNCIHKRKCYPIIAQSPSLNLESIPVVRVEEEAEIQARQEYSQTIVGEALSIPRDEWTPFIKGYKAAQSKGSYSEAQVLKAAGLGFSEGLHGKNTLAAPLKDKILAIIQPKIVVECEPVWTKNLDKFMPNANDYELKPITFKGEDGRTHFKTKTV